MYYFAYGSNMNHKQMKQRCPNSKFIKKVFLEGYKFIYDGYSSTRQDSVANIIKSNKDIIWGGLFEINEDDLSALDCYEGYPKYYDRKGLTVSDETENKYKAIVYLRTGKQQGKPSKEYFNLVIQGAKDCGLPEDYIKRNLLCD
jgi:gamma-glutamylcyclotransferase (GGCT)/AIG2-like uncharacterized protein YtfP